MWVRLPSGRRGSRERTSDHDRVDDYDARNANVNTNETVEHHQHHQLCGCNDKGCKTAEVEVMTDLNSGNYMLRVTNAAKA